MRRVITHQTNKTLLLLHSQKAFLRFVYGEKIEDRRAEEDERERESLFFLSAPRFAFSFGRGIIRTESERDKISVEPPPQRTKKKRIEKKKKKKKKKSEERESFEDKE